MKIRFYLFIISGILLLPESVCCQVKDSTLQAIENKSELNAERSESENAGATAEQELDFVEQLMQHPLDPNTASLSELQQIPDLSDKLAQHIVSYRESHLFENIDELTRVKGIGKVTLNHIRPFLQIDQTNLRKNLHFWTNDFSGQYLARFQRSLTPGIGYQPDSGKTGYLGNPTRLYQRLTLFSRHLSLNLTQEKDPGEQWDGSLGFDYTSGHFALYDVGVIRHLVLGDYSLAFGQGLAIRTSGSMGMGSDVITGGIQNSRGLRPYTSTDENHFLRGIAATVGNRLSATLFYSKRRYSATIISSDTIAYPSFTGYYRTPTEYARRYNNGAMLYGAHLKWTFRLGTIGFTELHNQFDHYIAPDTRYYRLYFFSGSDADVQSFDYRFNFGNQALFGETARSGNNAMAFLTGIRSKLSDHAELIGVWRNYNYKFQSIFGNALSQKSGYPNNEEGFYVGLKLRLTSQITFRTYFDQFYYPKPRYRVHSDSQGYEWLGVIDYRNSNGFSTTVLGSYQDHGIDTNTFDSLGRDIRFTGIQQRFRLRGQIEVQSNPHIRLRSRIEWIQYAASQNTRSSGILLYQDIRWQPVHQVRLDIRYCFFDTNDYDSRVYAFENDLLYVFHIPAFYGQGQRMYLLLKWTIHQHITVWGKVGVTHYVNQHTIGSGLGLINGDKREDTGLMIRITW